MTDNKWDDSKIDSLLSSMPDIRDERLESDILMRLKQDERLHPPRRTMSKKWIPAVVAMAALLIFSLFIPSMLRQNDSAMYDNANDVPGNSSSQAKMSMDHAEDSMHDEDAEVASVDKPEAEAFNAAVTRMMPENHVLLQEDLQGFQPLEVDLVADEGTTVPITVLIPTERVATDFPQGQPDSETLSNEYATTIPETVPGFEEYHVNNEASNQMERATNGNPQPYYKIVMPSGQSYLTPSETGHVLTVEGALLAMKEVQNATLEKLVPETIMYGVQEQDGVAVITFTEPLDLSVMDQGEVNAMLEGFMLTAKSFNKQVRLENVIQTTFLRYDLTTVLPEPVGVNPIYFSER